MADKCECVTCCDGDHAGECKACVGWGDVPGEYWSTCPKCEGSGLCQVCRGANLPACRRIYYPEANAPKNP